MEAISSIHNLRTCHAMVTRDPPNMTWLLVGKSQGKRLLGRTRHRWVDNVKMGRGEIGWGGKDWINLAQDRDHWRALVNTIMYLCAP
jgi:hypothetical protein